MSEFPDTFVIAADGQSITCLHCRMTSYHPKDVENRYCGHCHIFHDDVWPPARQWWIDHKEGDPRDGADHPNWAAGESPDRDQLLTWLVIRTAALECIKLNKCNCDAKQTAKDALHYGPDGRTIANLED